MPVSLLFCSRLAAISAAAPPPGLLLRSVCADRDAPDLASLCHAVATGGSWPSVQPRGRGLLTDLVSRPGRQVETWVALTPTQEATGERLAGMISLVQSQSPIGIRHSIGWLLVHPQARRRGLARALVAHACRRAADMDAGRVWAECRSDWAESLAFWRAVGFEHRS
ncbi:MAG: GNAT family N-acetyltransferase [Planctomycetota bacterium]